METRLLEAAQRGVVFLTVNRRLAQLLITRIDQEAEAAGLSLWPTAQVTPFAAWLESTWEAVLDQAARCWPQGTPPLLLTTAQERLLWERLILETPGRAPLLHVSAAAAAAQEAWALLQEHDLELRPTDVEEHGDAATFLQWTQHFVALCRRHHWLPQAELPRQIITHLPQLTLPRQYCLLGFDRFSPMQEQLIAALRQSGCDVELMTTLERPGAAVRLLCTDAREELRLAARWARRLLEQEPDQVIGVVVPKLEQVRTLLEHTFLELLHPEALLPMTGEPTVCFDISLAPSLDGYAVIQDAFLLLELVSGETMEVSRYSRLLRSPYWKGAESEAESRAQLDGLLREEGVWALTMEQMLQRARRLSAKQGLELPQMITTLARLTPLPRQDSRLPSGWAAQFAQWLRLLGWPGERTLNSRDYQTVEAWQSLLASLPPLDRFSSPLHAPEALARLRLLAHETRFQPEGPRQPQVQIMGVLEAAGATFDALWIMGLSDDAWPVMPAPNPFLPLALQRRHGMPRSSVEQELNFAHKSTLRLLRSAPQVVASCPRQEEDRVLRVSPLIAHLPEVTTLELYPELRLTTALGQGAPLEICADYQAPAHPDGAVAGGVSLLRAQAHCPFQGFATMRLHATALPSPLPHLEPHERGNLVHSALQHFFAAAATSRELEALSQEAVVEKANRAADQALADYTGDKLTPMLRTLEQQRLARLLVAWLEHELKRETPFAVQERESRHHFPLAGLTGTVRLDRMDRLDGVGQVVLDYKSGTPPNVLDWLGERPREPQIPLYTALFGEELAAAVIAVVRPGALRFQGVAKTMELLPGVAVPGEGKLEAYPDWAALRADWHRVLTNLAAQWQAGAAQVDPLPKACLYCALPPLCRIGAVQHGPLDEEESDAVE